MIIRIIPVGDLKLSSSGDFVWATGPTYIRQRIAARFRFWLGEYFLDRRQGIPYLREVFVKNPNIDRIRAIFRQVLSSTPGVLAVNKMDLFYDKSARRLTFDFHATVEGGEVRVRPGDDDFIVTVSSV